MKQTDLVDERGVRQVWYACPLCDAQHTVVQPSELRLHRIGSAQLQQRLANGHAANNLTAPGNGRGNQARGMGIGR